MLRLRRPAPPSHLDLAGARLPLRIRVRPRSQRITLRLSPAADAVELALPSPRAVAEGLAFLERRRGWLEEALRAEAARARPFRPGLLLPVADRPVRLSAGTGRSARLMADPVAGDRLEAGPAGPLFAGRVRRWLVAEAMRRLEAETRALATAHGLKVAGVAVGDPAARWGSCSTSGRIRYSWRLILAPGHVRQAVVAHEVAHLVHPNHGAGFHALAGQLTGTDPRPAMQWLKANGRALHGYGREPLVPG